MLKLVVLTLLVYFALRRLYCSESFYAFLLLPNFRKPNLDNHTSIANYSNPKPRPRLLS